MLAQPAKHSPSAHRNPNQPATVEIARIEKGVKKQWEIQGLQSPWWRFLDVDYFININVHAQYIQYLMSVEIGLKAYTLVACGQTWQGHVSCLINN